MFKCISHYLYIRVINLVMVLIMCVITSIASRYWNQLYFNTDASFMIFRYEKDMGNLNTVGFIAFWTALIAFQNIVPIALYMTVEIVKTLQV